MSQASANHSSESGFPGENATDVGKINWYPSNSIPEKIILEITRTISLI